jgi:phosphatidylserine/phosphatidylglycerophosphate/cardiolipin synthase-like enzyme
MFKRTVFGLLAIALLASSCGRLAPQAAMSRGLGMFGAREDLEDRTRAMDLITLPDQGPQGLVNAVKGAQKSIQLEIYMITNSGTAGEIVNALVERAKAGVDVRVMVESKPFIPPQPPHCDQAGNVDVNKKARESLIAGGVKVKYASPRFKYTHEKAMVIDGSTAYIMTTNFTGAAFLNNREYVVVDRIPADVAEVAAVFEADWQERPYVPQNPAIVLSPTNSRSRLRDLLASATKSIEMNIEFAMDPELIGLMGAKAKAGVDVQVLLSAHGKDKCTGESVNDEEARILTANGVTKFAFMKKLNLHAKAIVVDGVRAYIGSENLTANSLDNNRELGLIFTDRTLINTLLKSMRNDWFATTATPFDIPAPDVPVDAM